MPNPHFNLFVVLMLVSTCASAQVELVRIGHPDFVYQPLTTEDECTKTLMLPFFDDFSLEIGQLNTELWRKNSGVYLNNHYSDNHPSAGIATFDGVDAFGQPYQEALGAIFGVADSLVSHCIDLSGLSADDSFVFSFYYQAAGLGEQPNLSDSLILIGLDANGSWRRLWSAIGDTVLADYRYVELVIDDPLLFHPGFKFAFFNYAKVVGGFDHWHLDYIYVYQSTMDDPVLRRDVALTDQPTSFLQEYSAMPFSHFKSDPLAFMADSISTKIRNLSNTFVVTSHSAKLRQYEYFDGVPLPQQEVNLGTFSFRNGVGTADANVILDDEMLGVKAVNNRDFVDLSYDSTMVEAIFYLDNEEGNELIPTRNNDTVRSTTVFRDYTAYDDGTAEFGLGVRQKFGYLACQFYTPFRAPLTDIDIYIPQFGEIKSGGIYRLMIWQNIARNGHGEDEILLQQTRPVVFPDSINQFDRLNIIAEGTSIDRWLYVEDTFYIGIQQVSDEMLAIGFDKNYPSSDKIFYEIGSGWQSNPGFEGSLMIRPVFRRLTVTGMTDEKELDLSIYPNPASNSVHIRGDIFNIIKIYRLDGRQVFAYEGMTEDLEIDVSTWESSIYLVKVTSGASTAVRKFFVK